MEASKILIIYALKNTNYLSIRSVLFVQISSYDYISQKCVCMYVYIYIYAYILTVFLK